MDSTKGPTDRLLQVLVVGESGVGKTSLVDRVIHDAQYVRYEPAGFFPGECTRSDTQISLSVDGCTYEMELQDVSLTPIRLRDPGIMLNLFVRWLKEADGIVLMYDITDEASYDHVTKWAWSYIQACRTSDLGRGWDDPIVKPRRFGCVLIGNKVDLVRDEAKVKREVPRDLAQEWAEMVGVQSFEVDRFDRPKLHDVMTDLVRSINWADRRDREDMEMEKAEHVTESKNSKTKHQRLLLMSRLKEGLRNLRRKPEVKT